MRKKARNISALFSEDSAWLFIAEQGTAHCSELVCFFSYCFLSDLKMMGEAGVTEKRIRPTIHHFFCHGNLVF